MIFETEVLLSSASRLARSFRPSSRRRVSFDFIGPVRSGQQEQGSGNTSETRSGDPHQVES